MGPPPTANPPSGWALSLLATKGMLSLISCILPSLKRQIFDANLSILLPFEPPGLAPVLWAFVLMQPLVLLEAPHSSIWRPPHFLLQAQRPQVAHWYLCCSLVLEPCFTKGLLLPSSLPSPQWSRQNVRVLFLNSVQAQLEARTLGL